MGGFVYFVYTMYMTQFSSRRILILYTAHTLGHKTIAENIGYHLEQDGFEVRLADALKTEETASVSKFLWVHTFINTHMAFIWKWLYMWAYIPTMPFRTLVAKFHAKKILAIINEYKPDVVITTQTSPSAVISYLKSKKLYNGKFGVAFSDFHFHPYWAYPGVDFYLANIPEQAAILKSKGVDPASIFICGMTLRPLVETANLTDIRASLHIPVSAKVVLVGSGSMGIRFPDSLTSLIIDISNAYEGKSEECHIIVACGRNNALVSELTAQFKEHSNVHILGFYTPMQDLYSISDVFITKPGGLSVSEALREGLPLIVTHILPGQEELNLRYLSDRHLVQNLYVEPSIEWARLVIAQLDNSHARQSLILNPARVQLVEWGKGEAVIEAVRSMFHE